MESEWQDSGTQPADLVKAREKLAEQLSLRVKVNSNSWETVFAKEKGFARDITVTMLRSDYDAAIKANTLKSGPPGFTLIAPTVIFCLGYQSSLDKSPHITAMTLFILRRDREAGKDLANFPNDISTVRLTDLIPYLNFSNSAYAD